MTVGPLSVEELKSATPEELVLYLGELARAYEDADPGPEDGELAYTSALEGGLSGLESFAEPDVYPGQCPGQIGLMELLGLE